MKSPQIAVKTPSLQLYQNVLRKVDDESKAGDIASYGYRE